MYKKCVFTSAITLALALIAPQTFAEESKLLRVCAAEDEMPYSNKAGEGFENKLALLVGKALNRQIQLVTWTDPRYYVRDILEKGLCDVSMGMDQGDPRVLTTKPYYRSGYVFIVKEDADLELENWDSKVLREVERIGFEPGTPPEVMMKAIGRYNDMFNYSQELVGFKSRRNQYVKYEKSKMVADVASGHAQVAALWAPAAARYVKESKTPLKMIMIPDNNVRADGQKVGHHYSTSMGVNKKDPTLLAQLNKVIEDNEGEITELLEEEGIPLLPEPETD